MIPVVGGYALSLGAVQGLRRVGAKGAGSLVGSPRTKDHHALGITRGDPCFRQRRF